MNSKHEIFLLSFLVIVLTITGCSNPEEPPAVGPVVKGQVYEQTCAACHGAKGEGNRELGAPSIAALPAWYVTQQLEKFRSGYRGTHPEDIHGQQMRAIALMLDENTMAEAAEKIQAMPKILTTSTDPNPPSIKRAREIFADYCMSCHRWNGSGERAFRSAPLTGLPDWYHAAQLKKYRDGWRGAHEDDQDGKKMAVIASRFDDETIRAMAAYIAELAHGDNPRLVIER